MNKILYILMIVLLIFASSCKQNNIKEAEMAYQNHDLALCLDLLQNEKNEPAKVESLKGMCFLEMSQFLKAIDHFSNSITLNPNNKTSYFNRAIAYDSIGRENESIMDLSKVIEIDPFYLEAYTKKAYIFGNMGDFDKALKELNNALKIDSSNCVILNNKASILIATENYSEAIRLLTRSLGQCKDQSIVYYNRGICYLYSKLYERALTDLDSSILLDPNNGRYYLNRGFAQLRLNDSSAACADWIKAKELNNKEADLYIERLCQK